MGVKKPMTPEEYDRLMRIPYYYARDQFPWQRLWYKSVPFNEAEWKAFLAKCQKDGVPYPAAKMRELCLAYAGYEHKSTAQLKSEYAKVKSEKVKTLRAA